MKNEARKSRLFGAVGFGLLFTLAVLIITACSWFRETYDIGINGLLYTAALPLKGTGKSVVALAAKNCLPAVGAFALLYGAVAYALCQRRVSVTGSLRLGKVTRSVDALRDGRRAGAAACVLALLGALVYADQCLGLTEYLTTARQETTLYEQYYVDPLSVGITAGETPKNIIYLYLESMETTYASQEDGGAQAVNYIPRLTELAMENISFSDGDRLGGFHSLTGTGWTMGALFASLTGVPFSFPVGQNSMDLYENFASGITALGDILADMGYTQEFLCGSDASFAGRKTFFQQHGNYDIFDYYTAIDQGYIDEDYYVWWGFEDAILYQIAEDELTRLAAGDEPFNLTLLTVDTHHVGGYVCDLCGDAYDDQLANVAACADEQAARFVQWCQAQSFYEDTVIVISGDHPRMDTDLVSGVEYYDRTIYNCILNSDREVRLSTTDRAFTTMDMFPTALYALGLDIEGDRLGLGTNLFSAQPTLLESLGRETLDAELGKTSDYYIDNFS